MMSDGWLSTGNPLMTGTPPQEGDSPAKGDGSPSRGYFSLCITIYMHGKTRWLTVTDFHGSLDIEMFEFILFSNAQIEIFINWCMERGHMNLHSHLDIVTFYIYGSFSCKLWCRVKSTLLRGTPVPLLRGSPPLEGGGVPSWAGFLYWADAWLSWVCWVSEMRLSLSPNILIFWLFLDNLSISEQTGKAGH